MNIKEFKGKKYDFDKVANYDIRVEKKIEKIEEDNNKRYDRILKAIENGYIKDDRFFHENGFCTFCGAVRPSGEIGVGCGCAKIIRQFLHGYIHNEQFNTIPTELTEKYFNAYKKYVKYARALYLYHNTKNHDMKTLKAFRNEFKKSFTQSMINNTECRISKKQLEVIERDSEGFCYGACIENSYHYKLKEYKSYVFCKYYYCCENGYNEYVEKVFNSIDFGCYCRIEIAKAWL